MKLKYVVILLYFLVSVPLFAFFVAEPIVWISFFANYFLISVIIYYHLNIEKTFSPFLSSYIVFVFLFFLVAPMIQITSIESNGYLFPNAYPYKTSEVLFSNVLIFIFNFLFIIGYIALKKFLLKPRPKNELTSIPYTTPLLILVLLGISLLIGLANYDFLIDEFQRSTYMKSDESVSSLLIRKKVLFLIPLGAIVIAYSYLKRKGRITKNTIVVFFILLTLIALLLIFKNPLTEKRNALGPIYITLIFVLVPKLINNNAKFFLFMFIAMVIFFPVISAFTHLDATFQELIAEPKLVISSFVKTGGITDTFNTLHYDAFSNIMATVDYVSKNGYSYGFQLLSAFLFFVPRSLWASKPTSTGELIGNYLIEDYDFRYSNLSNPLVSEGFINFGIFGVVIMAIMLAYFIIKFTSWLSSKDYLKVIMAFYFSVHLIFLMRGDFTNGFSYFVGTFVGVLLIPRIIDKTISFSFKKKTPKNDSYLNE